jgi:hypothetical protein
LSYSALALYEHCGYRFYVERVLGARQSLVAATGGDEPDEEPDEMVDPGIGRGRALGIGNAVHAALEWSARRAWRPPDSELLELLLAREGLAADSEARARAQALVSGWLGSELRGELGAGRPEVPFALGLAETVVRGQIDLLVAASDAHGIPTVVDYKTDALDGRGPAELGERYAVQRQIYALAADTGSGARAIHVFLDAPDDPVIEGFDPRRLAKAREHLDSLVARMRGDEFEVTAEPYGALCHGCPAAARLCPRPAWRPSA